VTGNINIIASNVYSVLTIFLFVACINIAIWRSDEHSAIWTSIYYIR